MKYSKTQNLMMKMAEENKELHGSNIKTYYTIQDANVPAYASTNIGKPLNSKPGQQGLGRMSHEETKQMNYK
jgi:hypothetical protein